MIRVDELALSRAFSSAGTISSDVVVKLEARLSSAVAGYTFLTQKVMAASPSTIRLATASPGTQATTAATLAQLALIAQRAASSKADILLLPEAYLGGYPRGTSFGCVIGNRSAEGREEFARYYDQAVDLGDTVGDGAGAGQKWVKRQIGADEVEEGSETPVRGDGTREELERIARETGVFVVTGLIEKTGGSLYCAVVYVCPKLGIIGKRRKVMPTGTERLVWAQGSPATLRAVSTTIRGVRINLAAAICWENYMPLLRQALYSQNINLWLAPTADARDAWLGLMRTVGVEGRCFVVSSNMCVPNDAAAVAAPAGSPEQTQQDGPRGRRNSAYTSDGFEIALPRSPASTRRRTRRKSIIDENGNEIVLCCDEDADDKTAEAQTVESSTAPSLVNGNAPAVAATTAKSSGDSGFICRGGSSIVSPFGDVLAGPQWEDPDGIIYADVDFRDCIRGRLDLDAAGSYSRNDSFKFSVEGLNLDPLPY
ncbi:Nitrilase [Paramyrothecium foliicola]|nr:Nitrilase [Paramyrothecium foliicola]